MKRAVILRKLAKQIVVKEDEFYKVCINEFGISRKLSKVILRQMIRDQTVAYVTPKTLVIRTWVTS